MVMEQLDTVDSGVSNNTHLFVFLAQRFRECPENVFLGTPLLQDQDFEAIASHGAGVSVTESITYLVLNSHL